MIIDPITKELFTNTGEYLKTLECPLEKEWDKLAPAGAGARHCESCSRDIHDTAMLTDEKLKVLLKSDPGACLTVSLAQENCFVKTC